MLAATFHVAHMGIIVHGHLMHSRLLACLARQTTARGDHDATAAAAAFVAAQRSPWYDVLSWEQEQETGHQADYR
jgi:hypothetical protein